MIPKKIHYCWFGRNPEPPLIEKCIASWRKFLPDYEIIRWDEDNYDVEKIPFTKQAYIDRKYAFVSDYARFDILSSEGGIYMDTDVELIKTLDNFLHHEVFTGFEKKDLVAPGLIIGAVPHAAPVQFMKCYYEQKTAFSPNDVETVVTVMTRYYVERGLRLDDTLQQVEETTIYPTEFFAPLDFQSSRLLVTERTVSIHHYAASWLSASEKIKVKAFQFFTNLLGEQKFSKLREKLKK